MASKAEAKELIEQHQDIIGRPISKSSSSAITHLAIYPVTGNPTLVETFQNDLFKNGTTDAALAASEENDYQVFVVHYLDNPKKSISRPLMDFLNEERNSQQNGNGK